MIKYILMDVEGTTTSIDFVHNVLFPYAKKKLSSFLNEHGDICTDELKELSREEKRELSTQEALTILTKYIEQDIKHTALKSLQGKIWQLGYESGEIKGHVYPDVLGAFKKWKEEGLTLGIYSSGSVLAQKLIFGHSEAGDLALYLSDHFDTNIGHKRDIQSYINIANELKLNPNEILFLSDISQECEASMQAGFQTIQLLRDEKAIPDTRFLGVKDFLNINLG